MTWKIEIHECCRNTKRNIPKLTTGPHAASSKATCCVPNGVGVGRWVATSMIVEMQAKNWTAIQALNNRTSVKANCKANKKRNLHLKYYNSPHSRCEIRRPLRFWTRDSWATNKPKIRIIPSKSKWYHLQWIPSFIIVKSALELSKSDSTQSLSAAHSLFRTE